MNSVPGYERARRFLVLGLGKTGLSFLRYLAGFDVDVMVLDTRMRALDQQALLGAYPNARVWDDSEDALHSIDVALASPGLKPSMSVIVKAHQLGIPCLSDMALFARATQSPVIAITGSNGKTTTTVLVETLLHSAGLTAVACGNIGLPVLDAYLDADEQPDFYVCELSSFQLERTPNLRARVAICLNVTPDHLEWHGDMAAYAQAKMAVYEHCGTAVIPKGESWASKRHRLTFSTKESADVCVEAGYFVVQGEPLLAVSETPFQSEHEQANACAALACLLGGGVKLASVTEGLKRFHSLPHRCEWIATHRDVMWFNDSKATNVGSACAAMHSVGAQVTGRLIMIMGGLAKGADLSVLREPVSIFAKRVIVLGEDAPTLKAVLSDVVNVTDARTMKQAISLANQEARPGDAVLLSPACASFDMFSGFENRGHVFSDGVRQLIQEEGS